MLARSQMGGPWSRAQQIARAFLSRGHEVTLAWGDDGNCVDPIAPTLEIPVPSPLGLPEAIARHTFPLASRLGVMGRKPVHSFEEVLWLTGSLDYRYSCVVVEKLREFMRSWRPDVVYSEFNLAAVIAARAEGIPCVGSGSQPTTLSYASNPRKSSGIRRLLREMGMPAPASSLSILEGMKRRFIPSCPTLEPRAGERAIYCGFLDEPPALTAARRDCALVYLGSGSVPAGVAMRAGRGAELRRLRRRCARCGLRRSRPRGALRASPQLCRAPPSRPRHGPSRRAKLDDGGAGLRSPPSRRARACFRASIQRRCR